MTIESSSTPSFTEFNPTIIPYQMKVLSDLDCFDYKQGVHEVLLSGSVGSAKSILMAHAGIRHCVENEKARLCLARKSMPDLKDTILATVLEHMEGDFEEGVDYEHNETKGKILFSNGSEIISRSWADKKYKRFRSIQLSAALVEELTENNHEDKQAYDELKMRVGRLPHVKSNFLMAATNPDAPSHWAYKYFITSDSPTRHVYFSVTTDNPFLPKWYIDQLLKDLDPKMAQRMVYGKWLEIGSEVVYYSYSRDRNFRNETYAVDERYPVEFSFDFNIGVGKPMSCCFYQYVNGEFHFFNEAVVDGARTEDLLEDMGSRGLFEYKTKYIYHGDASGKHRDTRNKFSDYDIIKQYLSNYKTESGTYLNFEGQVPISNPPVRKRHNEMNALMQNAYGDVRLYVYREAPTLDEGLRLTKLRPGGDYVEDDSPRYQHISTAAGYGCMSTLYHTGRKPQGMVLL